MKHKRLFAFSLFVSLLWASLQARQIDLSLNDWPLSLQMLPLPYADGNNFLFRANSFVFQLQ